MCHFYDVFHDFSFSQLDMRDTCVNFTVERWYPVANMSRYLPIRVYDYYAPGKQAHNCVTFSEIIISFRCLNISPPPFFIVSIKTWLQGQKLLYINVVLYVFCAGQYFTCTSFIINYLLKPS